MITIKQIESPAIVTDAENVNSPISLYAGDTYTCVAAAAQSGIAYKDIQLTGQTISYATGDDADSIEVYTPPTYPVSFAALDTTHATPFLNLLDDNAFSGGNKNRFTDEDGLQVYGNDYVIDHLTRKGWKLTQTAVSDWSTAITNANAYTSLGFTDFRLPNINEIESLINYGISASMNYAPFNNSSARFYWTSTTSPRSTTSAIRYVNATGTYFSAGAKTSVDGYSFYVRNHY